MGILPDHDRVDWEDCATCQVASVSYFGCGDAAVGKSEVKFI
jgi:hypothetical protein